MVGDLGTSQNGTVHAYYTCSHRKTSHGVPGGKCRKKSERQDFLEWYIVRETLSYVLTEEHIAEISEKIEKLSIEDSVNNGLREAEERKKAINRELDDLTEKFIATKSQTIMDRINARAEELSGELSIIESEISRLSLRVDHTLKAVDIARYLHSLKSGDPMSPDFRRRIIDTFIQRVYLFDDKILVYYNIKNTAPIEYESALADLDGLQSQLCSDSCEYGSPNSIQSEHILYIYTFHSFGALIRIER